MFLIPQNSWKWFLYTRTRNVNRPVSESDGEQPRKKVKEESKRKHCYPAIPADAEDETSNSRNLELIKNELAKPDPSHESMKLLMSRTFPIRRASILKSESVKNMLEEYPLLKRSAYVSSYTMQVAKCILTLFLCCMKATLEFGLIMQRSQMKEEFDENIISWAKAIMLYSKQSCMKTTAIKKLIDATDFSLSCEFYHKVFVIV